MLVYLNDSVWVMVLNIKRFCRGIFDQDKISFFKRGLAFWLFVTVYCFEIVKR
jgi:hypothetical protein